ncbi:MAG: hypothetical protein LBH25_12820 [Fibromonadaceae bacterium]|nr:hypothetical protein [Fibromonadaceae bacterium]
MPARITDRRDFLTGKPSFSISSLRVMSLSHSTAPRISSSCHWDRQPRLPGYGLGATPSIVLWR